MPDTTRLTVELERTVARAIAFWTSPQVLGTAITLLAVFIIAAYATRGDRGGWRRLATRNVAHDAAWSAFYIGGFYSVFVGGPAYALLSAAVKRWLPWLDAGILERLHPVIAFPILWFAMDLVAYWWHRGAHRSPQLWAFHRVHHSQTQLTPLTNFRFHFIDILTRSLLQFVPALILGAPAGVWLAAFWMQTALDGLAHADTSWSYGVAGKVVNNPRFHRLHHSAEERHHGMNFGLSFCVWDRIFGTALDEDVRPAAFGLGTDPQSLVHQVAAPFGEMFGAISRDDNVERLPTNTSRESEP